MKDNLDKVTIHQYMMQQGRNGYAKPRRLAPEQRKACKMRRKIEAIEEIRILGDAVADGWDE